MRMFAAKKKQKLELKTFNVLETLDWSRTFCLRLGVFKIMVVKYGYADYKFGDKTMVEKLDFILEN